jgi:hypothetical protein
VRGSERLRWLSDPFELGYGAWRGEPISWLFRGDNASGSYSVRPTLSDLADAALPGTDRGARRLQRLGMIRLFVGHALGVHPDRIRLERRIDRGLQIVAPEKIHISDAGRDAWSAIAIADRPVGVDIETRPAKHPLPLDLLPDDERNFLAALDTSARELAFLRFWTAREAYLKAVEGSLTDCLPCAIESDDGTVELRADATSLGFARTAISSNYVAAMALSNS